MIVHINYLLYKLTPSHAYPVWTPIFLRRLDDNEEKIESKAKKRKQAPVSCQCDNLSKGGRGRRVEGERKKKKKTEKKHRTGITISGDS